MTERYRPVDAFRSPRFSGIRTYMRLPYVTDMTGVDFAVVGLPFDTATSYRTGARFGPEAIRSASALLRPYNPEQDVDIFAHLSGVDAGDLELAPGDTEATYRLAQEGLGAIVEAGVFAVVLGGDHAITLAELRVHAARHGPLALVHLDAHGDTWHEYFGQRYFHGTPFRRAAEEGVIDPAVSVQAGMRGSLYGPADIEDAREMGFTVLSTRELRELGPAAYGDLVREKTAGRPAFLSFDVDFCDPAFAPGTGTPEIGGPSSGEAAAFVRALTGVNLVGCDVVEVAPAYDSPGQPTALLAANIAWEAISLRALARAGEAGR
ncbi:MAG TPA: agmatinase [Gaiellales bacterium]|nr:agmatinase [Gaiellales bacterium]